MIRRNHHSLNIHKSNTDMLQTILFAFSERYDEALSREQEYEVDLLFYTFRIFRI